MYQLQVYFPGDPVPQAAYHTQSASAVIDLVQKALADHAGCERVVVTLSGARLFAVDCAGNRLP
jgi:hypothetical protein